MNVYKILCILLSLVISQSYSKAPSNLEQREDPLLPAEKSLSGAMANVVEKVKGKFQNAFLTDF